MEDRGRHLVQQVTVMADHDQGLGIGLEVAFQPDRGLQVEMVGRLVEQQQLRLLEQHRGQRHTHPPAAGILRQRADACGEPERSEEHTSELQSLMRISYAVFCLKKKKTKTYNDMNRTICKKE